MILAGVLSESIRQNDFCFRYGGEEFSSIFNAENKEDAIGIMERLRLKVRETDFPQVKNLTLKVGERQGSGTSV